MKESTKTILIFLGLILSLIFAPSCTKQETIHPTACNGNCDTYYTIIYENQEIFPNVNGHYEIEWNGLNYFQVRGTLTELNSEYCNSDGVPFIQANFDSDYWVVFDNLFFQTPQYSYLGWFNNNSLTTPIPIGSYTYTMNDLIDLHPPLNVVGYQIPKHFCTDCPYAPTIIGTYSKYNYEPTQNILLDDEMIGDEINIFIETTFNTEGGPAIYDPNNDDPNLTIKKEIKVIVI